MNNAKLCFILHGKSVYRCFINILSIYRKFYVLLSGWFREEVRKVEQPREPIFYPNKIPCSIGVDNKTENTLQSKEFETLENMQNENGKVEVIIIKTESAKLFVSPFYVLGLVESVSTV